MEAATSIIRKEYIHVVASTQLINMKKSASTKTTWSFRRSKSKKGKDAEPPMTCSAVEKLQQQQSRADNSNTTTNTNTLPPKTPMMKNPSSSITDVLHNSNNEIHVLTLANPMKSSMAKRREEKICMSDDMHRELEALKATFPLMQRLDENSKTPIQLGNLKTSSLHRRRSKKPPQPRPLSLGPYLSESTTDDPEPASPEWGFVFANDHDNTSNGSDSSDSSYADDTDDVPMVPIEKISFSFEDWSASDLSGFDGFDMPA